MQLQQNISLKPYNTFGIDVTAEYFIEIANTKQLLEIAELPYKRHVLGGGSNILLTKNIKGLVLYNCLKGIRKIKEDDEYVWLEAKSGVLWHHFVMNVIKRGLGGIENLALIPGTVGAAPIQNIGAYGVEVKETIAGVNVFDWKTNEFGYLHHTVCGFSYRDSIFKREFKDRVFITSVVFKLGKRPAYNISYGAIEAELQRMGVSELSVKAIADAVINIRTSKLPDPKEIGNAGSFFKNPTITIHDFNNLQKTHPQIPSYPVNDDLIKVPAGWLIEQSGWKGYKKGKTGVHAKQALVLVNFGGAGGKEILQLSKEITASVSGKFGIALEREVQVW